MSAQKYKDEIEKVTKQLKTEKKEHEILKHINESLKTNIRVRGQELGFRSEELLVDRNGPHD